MSNNHKPSQASKKKGFEMPGAFTILFLLTILAVLATWFIPAGSYAKLSYDTPSQKLVITSPQGETRKVAANQDELKKLHVDIEVSQFTSGSITKPISIPNTYESLPSKPAGLFDIPTSMVQGTIEAVDVMVFILVLGGLIGVVKASGAFEAGLLALSHKTKGREFLLIFMVSILMILGGTLCGIEEEAVAFYPILVPVFIAMGYDSIICVGAIFLASSVGTTFSTINPFSVVIASNAAGISFTDGLAWRLGGLVVATVFVVSYLFWYAKRVKANPSFSYSYEDREAFNATWNVTDGSQDNRPFDWKQKIILTLFVVGFPIMVYGVMALHWWFPIMAASFLSFAVIIMFLTGMGKTGIGEKAVVDAFVEGASSLVGVSLIIGLARGINLIMNEGLISDTILNASTGLVSHISGPIFILMLLLIFFVLGFIVPSSSGLAVLSMPILAPLADAVHIPRFIVVTAYQLGQYAMLFLAPTGLVMATLQMLNMKYSHWLRFVWPVVAFVLLFGGGMLVLQVLMYS